MGDDGSVGWGVESLWRADGGGVLAGDDFCGDIDRARSRRHKTNVNHCPSAPLPGPAPSSTAHGWRARGARSKVEGAYLRGGPGAPFSAAAASLQAPWSAPLPPRDVRGSIALLIAGSWRPRLTLLGRDRGVRWKADVRLAAGDIGTTRADTRTRGGLRAVGCAQTKCKQGS